MSLNYNRGINYLDLKHMKKEKKWQVYIIRTTSGKLYTGITTDLKRRLEKHKNKKGAKYFRTETPSEIVFTEDHKNRSEATKREIEIKKLSKKKKEELINK